MSPVLADYLSLPVLQAPLSGLRTLDVGRAVTLTPAVPGVLQIGCGRVWATLDGPHDRLSGDLFLDAGAQLAVQAGQRVVLEAFGRTGQAGAAFKWVPQAGHQRARWPATVSQPASDLRLALGSAGFALRAAARALVRLAGGVLELLPVRLFFAIKRVAKSDRLMRG